MDFVRVRGDYFSTLVFSSVFDPSSVANDPLESFG